MFHTRKFNLTLLLKRMEFCLNLRKPHVNLPLIFFDCTVFGCFLNWVFLFFHSGFWVLFESFLVFFLAQALGIVSAVLILGLLSFRVAECQTSSFMKPIKYKALRCRKHSAVLTDFGATGDGKTINTKAFKSAIDHLSQFADDGGAELIVPPGKWLTGSFNLTSHFTLYIDKDAVILGAQVWFFLLIIGFLWIEFVNIFFNDFAFTILPIPQVFSSKLKIGQLGSIFQIPIGFKNWQEEEKLLWSNLIFPHSSFFFLLFLTSKYCFEAKPYISLSIYSMINFLLLIC